MGPGSERQHEASKNVGVDFQFRGVVAGLRSQTVPVQPRWAEPSKPARKLRKNWPIAAVLGILVVAGFAWQYLGPISAWSRGPISELEPREEGSAPSADDGAAQPELALAPLAQAPRPVEEPQTPTVASTLAVGPRATVPRSGPGRRSRSTASEKPAISEVSVARVSATGSLSTAQVTAAVNSAREGLRGCHDAALRRGLDIKGTVTSSMVIRGMRVESIDLKTSIDSLAFRACVRKVLISVSFSSPDPLAYTDVKVDLFFLARRR